MSIRLQRRIFFLATTVVVACKLEVVQAWWGFGHYRVAVEIRRLRPDLNVDPDFSMVPDAFDAKVHGTGLGSWFDDELDGGISVEFTWSHGVQRHDGDSPPPAVPMYQNDDRYPGPVMYELATNKINYGNPVERQEAIATAIGDVVHNAADHIVHWQYFLGGEGLVTGPNLWVRNHCTKEEWASYILLMVLDAGITIGIDPGMDGILGTDDDLDFIPSEQLGNVFDFSNQGVVKWQQIYGGRPEFGTLATTGQMNFKADPKIMHMGMKAHRKNRRNSDIGGVSEFEVLTVGDIQTSISNEFNEPGAEFRNEVLRMNFTRWVELEYKATHREFLDTECGLPTWIPGTFELFPNASGTLALEQWSPSTVITNFNVCVQRGIAWLEEMQN